MKVVKGVRLNTNDIGIPLYWNEHDLHVEYCLNPLLISAIAMVPLLLLFIEVVLSCLL